jgi:hypothetical protein
LTDLAGNAVFDGIALGQVTITVSSSGFTGQSHTSTLPPDGGTARFIMSAGSGGPACTAAAPPPSPAALSISSFDWQVNRRTPLFFGVALNLIASQVVRTDCRADLGIFDTGFSLSARNHLLGVTRLSTPNDLLAILKGDRPVHSSRV